MIEGVTIEGEEDGFHLFVEGDLTDEVENYLSGRVETRLNLRLPQDVALALLREVDEKIRPWATEGEEARREFEAHKAHDGWVEGCPICEHEAALAGDLIEPRSLTAEEAGLGMSTNDLTLLSGPQHRALLVATALEVRYPGTWHRIHKIAGARLNTIEALERRGLVELRSYVSFSGFGHEARVTNAGRALAFSKREEDDE